MKVSDIAKRMIVTMLVIALICIVVSLIYYRSMDFLPFMFGVLIGTSTSIAKVFLLEWAVDKALTMEKKQAGTYVSVQHLLRLLLSGGVLALGALVPQINLWGVVAGILSYQIALYAVRIKIKKK